MKEAFSENSVKISDWFPAVGARFILTPEKTILPFFIEKKDINIKGCLMLNTNDRENTLGWANSSIREGQEKGKIGYLSRHFCH